MKLDFTYTPPDFQQAHLQNSPLATLVPSPADGIAPANYHATSNHPEYIKIAQDQLGSGSGKPDGCGFCRYRWQD